ncbi:MAG: NUDIX domain-containing protein [bacterium]|nr:NUDIX domain-containing protein [Candidatus Kapabacteria bacterium]
MQSTLVVSAAIVRDERVLMVQEGKEHCRCMWGLPGGRVEPGERLVDAIVREVAEETGLVVRVVGITRVLRYISQQGFHTVRVNFIVERVGGDLRVDGEEILDAIWMSFGEIDAMPDASLRTASIARQVISDVREMRVYPLDIVLDAI